MLSSLSMFAIQFTTTTNIALWGVGAVLLGLIVARRRSRKAKAPKF